jgi:hypothetical protein
MRIELEEKGHIYSVNGDIASISVTELLRKHGLAPDYSGVSKAKLRESATRGKEVHKDLENVLNVAKYEPTTAQGKHFKEWVAENLDCGVGEQMLAYERDGMIIAGTADVMGIAKDGTLIIGDHKNTASFHKEYVSWQVSVLDYFARKLGDEKVNGKALKWKGAKTFYCFHYEPKSGDMTVEVLDKVDDGEIEKLLDCEYNNTTYERTSLTIDKDFENRYLEAERNFIALEEQAKEAQVKRDELRAELLTLFEQQGIKSWDNGKVLVTYIPQTDRLSVDSKKLKESYPQVYSECQKLTKVKSQIRVTIREDEENDN